jgi:hypothetical protein
VSADGGIVLAGGAFVGPRIEAAHNSGLAAAHTLLKEVSEQGTEIWSATRVAGSVPIPLLRRL